MGLEATLEYDRIMHHSHEHLQHGSEVKERYGEGKPTGRNYVLRSLDDEFTELTFTSSLSPSLKILPPKTVEMTSEEELKRGSIYRSSKAVREIENQQVLEGCPVAQRKRMPLNPVNIYLDSVSLSRTNSSYDSLDFQALSFDLPEKYLKGHHMRPGTIATRGGSRESFLETCFHSKDRGCCCIEKNAELEERILIEEPKFEFDETIYLGSDSNGFLESASVFPLPESSPESSPEKLITPSSHCELKDNQSKASPKAWANPFRKILSPLIKSRSLWDPPTSTTKIGGHTISSPSRIRRTTSLRKSLMQEFSKTVKNTDLDGQLGTKNSGPATSSSPVHLHGILRLVYKHGVPFFEFLLKDPEDILAAKTWRTDNAFNWVYTFHSKSSKKESSNVIWGRKDGYKQSTIVAQMQVSSYLCSEVSNHVSLDNSLVTEFVLLDMTHARKNLPSFELNGRDLEPEKCGVPSRNEFGHSDSDAEAPYPWVPPNLYPHLEVAAMVIRFPLEKKDSLKGKLEDEGLGGKESPNLLNFSSVDQREDAFPINANSVNVKVVIPSGIHGIPSGDDGVPSPLLDRWRSGGGCDCGGWDMGCPIVVFDSFCLRNGAGWPPMVNQQPLELFVQGGREKVPALLITKVDEGVYSVDFHAQLSTLQAFSICVGILNGTEVSTAVGHDRNMQKLQSNSLKKVLKEEMRCLIEAAAEEERRKMAKKMEEIPPTFVPDPPVSPIGRL